MPVYKYRSFEEANKQRKEWELAHMKSPGHVGGTAFLASQPHL